MFVTRRHTDRHLTTDPPTLGQTIWMWVLAAALVALTVG